MSTREVRLVCSFLVSDENEDSPVNYPADFLRWPNNTPANAGTLSAQRRKSGYTEDAGAGGSLTCLAYGLAVHPSGEILVTDPGSGCVRVFSPCGESRLTIRHPSLLTPSGVCVTESGKMVVADASSRDLKVFSHSGKLLVTSERGMHLQEPTQLAYNPWTKDIAVVDRASCCVFIHNPQGMVKDLLTEAGNGELLAQPHGVTFGPDGKIYVTDEGRHKLVAYTSDHEVLFKCGQHGQGPGEFQAPLGMTTDADGNLLVADCLNSQVQLLSRDSGTFLENIVTLEDGLTEPQALAVGSEGHLIVVESTGLVKVFDYSQVSDSGRETAVSSLDGSADEAR